MGSFRHRYLPVLALLVVLASPDRDALAQGASRWEDADIHTANDPDMPRDTRCRGAFSLFDSRVSVGMACREVHDALLWPIWIEDTEIVPIYILAGLLPVEMTANGTVFRLSLFDPLGEEEVKWLVFLRLDAGAVLDAEDMQHFLAGEVEDSTVTLGEFALCFPGPPANQESWIQRYTAKGMEILEWY